MASVAISKSEKVMFFSQCFLFSYLFFSLIYSFVYFFELIVCQFPG